MSTLCALSSLLFLKYIFLPIFFIENVINVKRGFVGNNILIRIYAVPIKLDEETSLYFLAPCKMVFEITVSPTDELNTPAALS